MKVFRFMSVEEFEQLLLGKILYNYKNHKQLGNHSNSIGFCFMNSEDFTPEEAWRFLRGIGGFGIYNICVIFETIKKLKKSKGRYAKYEKTVEEEIEMIEKMPQSKKFESFVEYLNNLQTFNATEYCTTSYSLKDFKIIKVGFVSDFKYTIDWRYFGNGRSENKK